MPLYTYECKACGTREDAFRTIPLRDEYPLHCSLPMARVIVAPFIAPDLPGYVSPVTGAWVEGRRARTEDLARTGSRPFEAGEREEAARRRKALDAELDASIEETVGREIEAMPSAKRERLGNELEAGASAEVVRLEPTI